jgi:hypothetical protein
MNNRFRLPLQAPLSAEMLGTLAAAGEVRVLRSPIESAGDRQASLLEKRATSLHRHVNDVAHTRGR